MGWDRLVYGIQLICAHTTMVLIFQGRASASYVGKTYYLGFHHFVAIATGMSVDSSREFEGY